MSILRLLCLYCDLYVYTTISISILRSLYLCYDLYVYTTIAILSTHCCYALLKPKIFWQSFYRRNKKVINQIFQVMIWMALSEDCRSLSKRRPTAQNVLPLSTKRSCCRFPEWRAPYPTEFSPPCLCLGDPIFIEKKLNNFWLEASYTFWEEILKNTKKTWEREISSPKNKIFLSFLFKQKKLFPKQNVIT